MLAIFFQHRMEFCLKIRSKLLSSAFLDDNEKCSQFQVLAITRVIEKFQFSIICHRQILNYCFSKLVFFLYKVHPYDSSFLLDSKHYPSDPSIILLNQTFARFLLCALYLWIGNDFLFDNSNLSLPGASVLQVQNLGPSFACIFGSFPKNQAVR